MEEKSAKLKELESEILGYFYETDTEDDICENEAKQAHEIQENITYQLITVEDALKDIQEGNSPFHLRSGPLSNSSESIASNSRESIASNSRESIASNSRESIASNSRESIASNSKESVASKSKENVVSEASNDDCKSIVSTSLSLASLAMGERSVRVKLPKLQMHNFSGKVQDGQEFWDSFKSAIEDDPGLAKVDKFKYLRSFLDEPARRVISDLSLTDAEYDSAVEILMIRFPKPSLIKRALINDIMSLNPVFNKRNVGRLIHLLDDIQSHFRGLEALIVDKETYSSIVVPVLMDKLPESIRINMKGLEAII